MQTRSTNWKDTIWHSRSSTSRRSVYTLYWKERGKDKVPPPPQRKKHTQPWNVAGMSLLTSDLYGNTEKTVGKIQKIFSGLKFYHDNIPKTYLFKLTFNTNLIYCKIGNIWWAKPFISTSNHCRTGISRAAVKPLIVCILCTIAYTCTHLSHQSSFAANENQGHGVLLTLDY